MKAAVCTPLLLLVLAVPSMAQTEKATDIKCDMGYLEKTWGVKLKNFAIVENNGVTSMKLLLEFTKDVEDLQGMRQALTPPPPKSVNPVIFYHYFDKDGVRVGKVIPHSLQGELSGMKGDAFRLFLPFEGAYVKDAVKLEARPTEEGKPKTDKKDK